MTKLIIETEIDLDEIGYDIAEKSVSLDNLVKEIAEQEIMKRVTDRVVSTIPVERINALADKIRQTIENTVEQKMINLLNEELVLMDRWGKKTFVGSVEDFIKQEIDQKITAGVDAQGKRIGTVCNTQQTWLEWYIAQQSKSSLDRLHTKAEEIINRTTKELIHDTFFKAKQDTMKEEILKHLASVGVVAE